MKILIVGSKSIHVSSFIENLFLKGQSISLLSEEICAFPTIESEKNISFRSLNPFTVIRNYFKLKKYLGELNPSLIHIHQLNRFHVSFSSQMQKPEKSHRQKVDANQKASSE